MKASYDRLYALLDQMDAFFSGPTLSGLGRVWGAWPELESLIVGVWEFGQLDDHALDRFYDLFRDVDHFFNSCHGALEFEQVRANWPEFHGLALIGAEEWSGAARNILPDPEFEAAVDSFAGKLSRRGVGEAHLLRQAGVYSGAERVR